MGTFAAIYVETKPGGEREALERLRFVIRARPGTHHLRYRAGTGWVQVCPGSPHFDGDVLDAMLGKSPTSIAPSLTELAGIISSELTATVLSLEAQTTVDFALYSRWERGTLRRLIEYCGERESDDGVIRSVGESEPWESNLLGESPTAQTIGETLSLPGFGPEAWLTNPTYWTSEVEIRA